MIKELDILRHNAGGIVINELLGTFAIVQNEVNESWVLPQGKIEQEETPYDCIIREIQEELGIQSENIFSKEQEPREIIIRPLGRQPREDNQEEQKIFKEYHCVGLKKIEIFLLFTDYNDTLEPHDGVIDAKRVKREDNLFQLLSYPREAQIVQKILEQEGYRK